MSRLFACLLLLLPLLNACQGDENAPPVMPPLVESGAMVLIEAGSFLMGAPAAEPGILGDETQHPVTLTRDFRIFSTEVTNRQYADLAQWALDQGYCTVVGTRLFDNLDGSNLELLDMDADEDCEISYTGAGFVVDPGRDHHPVVEVRWHGAAAYCDWLSLKDGLPRAYDHSDPTEWVCGGGSPYEAAGYRLPTEAEWEYACRGGSATAFAGGDITETGCGPDPVLADLGWYCGNSDGWSRPVGTREPNAFGLYDMHGNVWEWTNDWYGSTFAPVVIDPVGAPPGLYRVLRGGSWSDLARRCRSASRRNPNPHKGVDGRHGFRVAQTAQ